MVVTSVAILAAGLTGSSSTALEATCHPVRFGGAVSHGQPFEQSLGGDLVFRLSPERHPANPPGWMIEVRSGAMPGPENELSWVVSPPYRFWNPRYLDTSHGWTAREAAEASRREFSFVVTAQEYRTAAEAVRKLLWPAAISEPELEEAQRALAGVRRATGTLTLLDSRIDEHAQGGSGRIEWIRFAVEICLP